MKKFILFSTVIILIIPISACRKRNVPPDNPDVNNHLIDSVSVAPSTNGTQEKAVDADQDGTTDFFMSASNDDDAFSTSLDAQQTIGEVHFSTDGAATSADYNEGALIDSVSTPKGPIPPRAIWANFGTCSLIDGISIYGLAGAGDVLVGFFITKPDGKHYGWLKLNIAANGKSIRLKETGYHTKARTAIKAGER